MAVFKPYSSSWDDEKENVYGYEYDEEQYPDNMQSLSVVNPDGNFANVLSQCELNDMGVNFSTSNHKRDLKVWELETLYQKALQHYPADSYKPIYYMYRDKPGDFFQKALNKDNGFMKSYPKDMGGDPRSPINGKLDGLFFACNVGANGMPPPVSFFGNTRLRVPAPYFFSPVSHYSYHSEGDRPVRLYFTDFYCMRGNDHWATLVMTYTGSFADKFCERKLFELSLSDNELFIVTEQGVFMRDSHLLIEIFYTSDVDLHHWLSYGAEIDNIQIAGKGSSTVGGLGKNVLCKKCKLY